MQDKVAQLSDLRIKVRAGGGDEKTAKQHAAGKKTARERIKYLLDPGMFTETGTFAGEPGKNPGEGVVTGFGLINSRKAYVYAINLTKSKGRSCLVMWDSYGKCLLV